MKLNRKVENKTQKVTHKFNGFSFSGELSTKVDSSPDKSLLIQPPPPPIFLV